jgi:hypothetical protein
MTAATTASIAAVCRILHLPTVRAEAGPPPMPPSASATGSPRGSGRKEGPRLPDGTARRQGPTHRDRLGRPELPRTPLRPRIPTCVPLQSVRDSVRDSPQPRSRCRHSDPSETRA